MDNHAKSNVKCFLPVPKANVCGSLLGTLMNDKWKTKDYAKARADLEELDIRPELRPDGTSA